MRLGGVDFLIPGNDDSIRAVRLYVSAFADACLAGRADASGIPQQKDELVEVAAAEPAA